MADLIQAIPHIQGCYLLTPSGTLGRYLSDGRFVSDPELTEALAGPIAQLLAEYRNSPDTRWMRLGIVHPDHTGKPWKVATLAFSDEVLRRLYPMSSQRDGRLTSFQLRHREQSLFRGMELLLDYRDPAIPEIPFFCPVLVSRGTKLADYLPWPERPVQEADRQIPAVEVIDLLAGLARSQRNLPAVNHLVATVHEAMVQTNQRKGLSLSLIDDVQPAAPAPAEVPGDPYAGEQDAEAVTEFEARYAANGFRDWDYGAWFKSQSTPQSRERFGHYLGAEGSYRFRGADELRFFERFEGLDRAALALIAAKSPVFKVPAGAQLLDAGTHDRWNLYLLSGEVELASPQGPRYPIAGGSPSARQPVAFLKPRVCSVTARTEVEFLWLYEPMIEVVKRLYPARLGSTTLH